MKNLVVAASCLVAACSSVEPEHLRDLSSNELYFAVGDEIYSASSGRLEATDKETGVVRALGNVSPSYELAVDSAHVYWAENTFGGGGIGRIATSGPPIEIYVGNQAADLITVDDEALYWSTAGWSGPAGIYRMAHADRTPMLLSPTDRTVIGLQLDGDAVVWCDQQTGQPSRCHSVPRRGGTSSLLLEAPGLAFWTVSHGGLTYSTPVDSGSYRIWYLPPGGTPTPVTTIEAAQSDDNNRLIAIVRAPDGRVAYATFKKLVWLAGDQIDSTAIDLASGYFDYELELDATHAYWVGNYELLRAPYEP